MHEVSLLHNCGADLALTPVIPRNEACAVEEWHQGLQVCLELRVHEVFSHLHAFRAQTVLWPSCNPTLLVIVSPCWQDSCLLSV
jgi:hypothetical protein